MDNKKYVKDNFQDIYVQKLILIRVIVFFIIIWINIFLKKGQLLWKLYIFIYVEFMIRGCVF